jgi:thiamine biosynthesis protein ThiC
MNLIRVMPAKGGWMTIPTTQMAFARAGTITAQKQHVVEREELAPGLVWDEAARSRMIIPEKVHHAGLHRWRQGWERE